MASRNKRLLPIIMIVAILIVVGVIIAVVVSNKDDDSASSSASKAKTTRERVLKVLDEIPLIDGHNDLPWQYQQSYRNQIEKVCTNKEVLILWRKL